MIKAKVIGKNGPVYLIGLSEANVTRLKAGEPIAFQLADIGLPGEGRVLIVYGETEEAIAREMNIPRVQ